MVLSLDLLKMKRTDWAAVSTFMIGITIEHLFFTEAASLIFSLLASDTISVEDKGLLIASDEQQELTRMNGFMLFLMNDSEVSFIVVSFILMTSASTIKNEHRNEGNKIELIGVLSDKIILNLKLSLSLKNEINGCLDKLTWTIIGTLPLPSSMVVPNTILK